MSAESSITVMKGRKLCENYNLNNFFLIRKKVKSGEKAGCYSQFGTSNQLPAITEKLGTA